MEERLTVDKVVFICTCGHAEVEHTFLSSHALYTLTRGCKSNRRLHLLQGLGKNWYDGKQVLEYCDCDQYSIDNFKTLKANQD